MTVYATVFFFFHVCLFVFSVIVQNVIMSDLSSILSLHSKKIKSFRTVNNNAKAEFHNPG